MGHRTRREQERAQRRIAAGLCTRCPNLIGDNGTNALCRACADKAGARKKRNLEKKKTLRLSPSGHVLLTCDNCFREFERREYGQHVFCDACYPWFEQDNTSAIDHEAEQAQARKSKPTRHHAKWAESLIDEWMR